MAFLDWLFPSTPRCARGPRQHPLWPRKWRRHLTLLRERLDRRPGLNLERLEDRLAPAGDLFPDLHLVNADLSLLSGQVFWVDAAGAQNVSYRGPVTRTGLTVPAF